VLRPEGEHLVVVFLVCYINCIAKGMWWIVYNSFDHVRGLSVYQIWYSRLYRM